MYSLISKTAGYTIQVNINSRHAPTIDGICGGFLTSIVCTGPVCFDQSQRGNPKACMGFYDRLVQSPFDVNVMDVDIWSRGCRRFVFVSRE